MSVRPNNPNYKFRILKGGFTGNSAPEVLEGWLPETFDFRVQSDWEPLLMNLADISKASMGNDILAGGFGHRVFLQSTTGQVWRGSGPIEFTLPIMLDAETNAYEDVTKKVLTLTKWCTPSFSGSKSFGAGVLQAPGPSISQGAVGGPMYTVEIGRFMAISNVIFPSMDVTFHTAPVESGDFIAADINLSIRTFFTPTQEDILGWFRTYKATDQGFLYGR